MTRNFSCLGNKRLASGVVVTLAKGGGQLALDDASSDVIRYFGGGAHCLIRDSTGSSSLRQEMQKNERSRTRLIQTTALTITTRLSTL